MSYKGVDFVLFIRNLKWNRPKDCTKNREFQNGKWKNQKNPIRCSQIKLSDYLPKNMEVVDVVDGQIIYHPL